MSRRYLVVKGKFAVICKKLKKDVYYYDATYSSMYETSWSEAEEIRNPDFVLKLEKGVREYE